MWRTDRWGRRPRGSTVLSSDEETLIVAFRRHTGLPLDDCLYALQATIPHLTRSALHRLFQRHGISRLPGLDGPPPRRQFRAYPLGYLHIDLAEVWTEDVLTDNGFQFTPPEGGWTVAEIQHLLADRRPCLTPFERICQLRTDQPERFRVNPLHHMPGLHI